MEPFRSLFSAMPGKPPYAPVIAPNSSPDSCPLPGKRIANSTSATLSARFFQQSNQVALKQLLMQVSEKSITQMGYGAQDSRPFLVFIAECAKNARRLIGT
ncbi:MULTISPECIES: hypothetical protein [Rhizobium]|uniref:DUF982 domain-containing protein n=1 Tax=Rhizobium croatiense TaxID=2867516 RepID=A0ABS7LXF5_9HYPH|nr:MULTISPECIES: hypothetical protein [Rhizobium]MBY4629232.1 hypothetical protein [Rhizobium croatiense]ULR43216.1 hypothetical protein MHI61_18605 [Rhizobium sp. K102]